MSKPEPKFKVGDKVRIKTIWFKSFLGIGEIVKVREPVKHYPTYSVKRKDGNNYLFIEPQLELITA